jgi:hypothetical protein
LIASKSFRSAEGKHNFATYDIVKVLRKAGWQIDLESEEEGAMLAAEMALAGLNERISSAISSYIEDRVQACRGISSRDVRKMVAKLARDVGTLLRAIPDETDGDLESVVVNALNSEMYELPNAHPLDLAFIRSNLEALQEAAGRIQREETGQGRCADRVKISFVKHLAAIFKDYTRKRGSRSPIGLFQQFVWAVNQQIPDSFGIPDAAIEHLIAVAACAGEQDAAVGG